MPVYFKAVREVPPLEVLAHRIFWSVPFVALLISIILMFLLHQLQLRQERLVLDTEAYVDTHLIRHLQAGASAPDRPQHSGTG